MAACAQALGGTERVTVVTRLLDPSNTSATTTFVLPESLKHPTFDRKSESTRTPALKASEVEAPPIVVVTLVPYRPLLTTVQTSALTTN